MTNSHISSLSFPRPPYSTECTSTTVDLQKLGLCGLLCIISVLGPGNDAGEGSAMVKGKGRELRRERGELCAVEGAGEEEIWRVALFICRRCGVAAGAVDGKRGNQE